MGKAGRFVSVILTISFLLSSLTPALAVEGVTGDRDEAVGTPSEEEVSVEAGPETAAAAQPEGEAQPLAQPVGGGEWLSVDGVEGGQLCFDSSTGTILECEAGVVSADIPTRINGTAATAIAGRAFANCVSLTTVTIPEGVISIGENAFYDCENLTSIEILSRMVSIGPYAFCACASLKTLTLPDGIRRVDTGTFAGCTGLKEVTMPDRLESIGENAFSECKSLTNIALPNTLREIDDGAFENCVGLVGVTIPESVTSIGARAFSGCTALPEITIPGGVTDMGYDAFDRCTGLTKVTVLEGVTRIGESVFENCAGLVSVRLPESLTGIDGYAFSRCTSLDNVVIPERVTELGDSAFGGCTGLTSVTLPVRMTDIASAFSGCSGLKSFAVPDGVTYIDYGAFYGCTGLTAVTLPESVTGIGAKAFYNCTGLSQINLPQSVTDIGGSAFYNCGQLKEIRIPEHVSAINGSTFYQCAALTAIMLPAGTASIGKYAFYGCSGITGVTFDGALTGIGANAFENCTSLLSLSIPAGVAGIGENTFKNCSSLLEVTIPKGVTGIGASAFQDCARLRGLILPDGAASIGEYAFSGCADLAGVSLPETLSGIGANAFENCVSLTGVTIPGRVTEIPSYAFYGCAALEKVVMLEGVSRIDSQAFGKCAALVSATVPESAADIAADAFQGAPCLENANGFLMVDRTLVDYTGGGGVVTIPEKAAWIGEEAFYRCTGLTGIVIPGSVSRIGARAFYWCDSLKTAVLSEGVTSVGDSAFEGCDALTAVSMPDSVTALGKNIFRDCIHLTSVTLPGRITEIAPSTFEGCEGLTEVNLPGELKAIGGYAFEGCGALTGLVLPGTVTSIGSRAFSNCAGLTSLTLPEGLRTIEAGTFSGCTRLSEVRLPEGLERIEEGGMEDGAFQNCSSLNSIRIPKSVRYIGSTAFDGTECLRTSGPFQFIDQFLMRYTGTDGHAAVPDGTAVIGEEAFSGADTLLRVTIPESVVYIGEHAFQGCNKLTAVRYTGTAEQWIRSGLQRAFAALPEVTVFYGEADGDASSASGAALSLGGEFYTASIGETVRLSAVLTAPDGDGQSLAQGAVWTSGDESVFTLNPDSQSLSGANGEYTLEMTGTARKPGNAQISVTLPDGAVSQRTLVVEHEFAGGSGTEERPWQIGSARQLQRISDDLSGHYELIRDIDCAGMTAWAPIGAEEPFQGTLNGHGHTIYGLTAASGYQGLFGTVEGVIENLTVSDFVVTAGISGGILAASNEGTIQNCQISGSLSGGVSNEYHECATGGIVGTNAGFIENCSMIVAGNGGLSGTVVGGIAGKNFGTITACRVTGTLTAKTGQNGLALVGGIVGWNKGGISYCKATGEVSASVYYAGCASGGIAGANTDSGSIENCCFRGTVYAKAITTNYGGLAGGIAGSNGDRWLGSGGTVRDCVYLLAAGGTAKNAVGAQKNGTVESNYSNQTGGKHIIQAVNERLGETQEGELPGLPVTDPAYTTIYDADLSEFSITVYENQRPAESRQDRYELSGGTEITCLGIQTSTGRDGRALLTRGEAGDRLVISKPGFAPVTRTMEQLRAEPTVYLEPMDRDRPVVTAVWLDGVDVRHHRYEVELFREEPVTLTADVEWGGAEGTIKLCQSSKHVSFTGGTLTTVLKDTFDVGQTIEIWAGRGEEEGALKPLKIQASSALPGAVDGLSFQMGDSMSATLPDSVPLIGGTKIGAGIYSPIPVTVSVEDGKVYAAIGFQGDSGYKKDKGWTPKTFSESVKNIHNAIKDAGSAARDVKDMMKKMDGHVAKGSGSFGVDAGFSVMGYAEGYFDPDGELHWVDSGLVAGLSASVSYSCPFALGPVPCFFETSLSGDVLTQLNLAVNEAAKQFTANGQLEGSLTLSGGLGVGIKKVASLSGGLEGKVKVLWEEYMDDPDYVKLTGSLNAYAKVEILFFSGKKSWDPIVEAVWYEYPERSAATEAGVDARGFRLYDSIRYEPKPESEMEDRSTFMANDQSMTLHAGGPSDATKLVSNIYSQAAPQLAEFSDGSLMAVWVGLDQSRAVYDRPCLYYSVRVEGIWSTPSIVSPDGTADGYPAMAIDSDTACLAWCDANAAMGAAPTLESAAAAMEISAAVYNRDTDSWRVERFTNNSTLDMLPVICGGESGAVAAWQSNQNNDWTGGGDVNSISYAVLENGTWSIREHVYSGIPSIIDMAVDGRGGTPRIAWSQDMDGDPDSTGDLEIYLDNNRLTENDGIDSGVAFCDGTLYWYHEGTLWADGTDTGLTLNSDRFKLVDGVLLRAESSGLGGALWANYYDETKGIWSDPVMLREGSALLKDFSPLVDQAGNLVVLMAETEITGSLDADEDPYGKTDLTLLNIPRSCDLALRDAWVDRETYFAGNTMYLYADVSNNGTRATNYLIAVMDKRSGQELASMVSSKPLFPGQREEVILPCSMGGQMTVTDLTLELKTLTAVDSRPEDNVISLALAYEDVSVEHVENGVSGERAYYVFADIANRGHSVQRNLQVSLYQNAIDDAAATAVIEELAPLTARPVSFAIPAPDDADCYYVAVSTAGGNENRANDRGFTVVTRNMSDRVELYQIRENTVDLLLNHAPAGTLILAAYEPGTNRMAGCGAAVVDSSDTMTSVTLSLDHAVSDYRLRAFLLEAGAWRPLTAPFDLSQ